MTLSPKDHMLTANEDAYKRTSLAGLKCVANALAAVDRAPGSVEHILDFGCGYGRVLRALKAGFSGASITACDLMPEAIEFCSTTFGATPVQGYDDLGLIALPAKYDVIWLGSVFTHLPAHRWTPLLRFLVENLKPNGVIVFTTHGRTALWVFENHTLDKSPMSVQAFEKIKAEYEDSGYSFFNYSTGHVNALGRMGIEVDPKAYGLAFSRPDWVYNFLRDFRELFVCSYTEGGWGRNHDVVSLWLPSDPRDIKPIRPEPGVTHPGTGAAPAREAGGISSAIKSLFNYRS